MVYWYTIDTSKTKILYIYFKKNGWYTKALKKFWQSFWALVSLLWQWNNALFKSKLLSSVRMWCVQLFESFARDWMARHYLMIPSNRFSRTAALSSSWSGLFASANDCCYHNSPYTLLQKPNHGKLCYSLGETNNWLYALQDVPKQEAQAFQLTEVIEQHSIH